MSSQDFYSRYLENLNLFFIDTSEQYESASFKARVECGQYFGRAGNSGPLSGSAIFSVRHYRAAYVECVFQLYFHNRTIGLSVGGKCFTEDLILPILILDVRSRNVIGRVRTT